jgi:argininosuccinate synthase
MEQVQPLYEKIATFDKSDYNQKDAEGFINLFGLPIKVQALLDQNIE